MDHFVRVVLDEGKYENNKLDESVFPSQKLLETVDGKPVIEIPLARELTDEEADDFADRLSAFMFESGYDNFDIEISMSETNESMQIDELFNQPSTINNEVPWNLGEDLVVFMRNDPMFYRKEYYPRMTRMSDLYRRGKKFDFSQEMMPVIEKAKQQYCEKYKLAKNAAALFSEDDDNSVIERIQEEEFERIKKGEY